jgi:hypothetical protein
MINVFRAPDKNGRDSIALVLSPDAMLVTAEGDPYPGGRPIGFVAETHA